MNGFPQKPIFLVGDWQGIGEVIGKDLQYKEMSQFHVVKEEPAIVVNWQQFTKHNTTEKPLHAENGFLKILPMKAVGATGNQFKAELMLSHPFSVNEMYRQCVYDFDNNTLIAEAYDENCFQRGPTAKGRKITGVKRVYKLGANGTLEYDMHLAIEGGSLEHHLWACLKQI